MLVSAHFSLRGRRLLYVVLINSSLINLIEAQEQKSIKALSTTELEEKSEEINTQLSQLANYSLRSGIGSIGYRSEHYDTPEHKEWIEIELDQLHSMDQVVIIPTIRRGAEKGFQADGFPIKFKIIAGTKYNKIGRVIAEYNNEITPFLPRVAPLVVKGDGLPASWLRVEVEKLSQREFDDKYVLQLSEILIFDGPKNVALGKSVSTLTNKSNWSESWDKSFLVDGVSPYIMDAARGKSSIAFISPVGVVPSLIIDLEEEHLISQIQLHAVEQGDTVPQAYAGNLGIPEFFEIESSLHMDFSDAKVIINYEQAHVNSTGPILMWNIEEARCRFIRLTAKKNHQFTYISSDMLRIGFSEIEIMSEGKNIAKNKLVTTDKGQEYFRDLAALTDGSNLYGEILPIKIWVNELARRHYLEAQLPLIQQELTVRYDKQKTHLRMMIWLTAFIAAIAGFIMLINRNFRLQEITQLKERIAADLHDELGASIHTIGLLSDAAKLAHNSPEKWLMLHQRIRNMTERTGKAIQYSTNMLESKGIYIELIQDMRQELRRMLSELDHSLLVDGEQYLNQLKPRTRLDLFLFYKECLNNICRHAQATSCKIELIAAPGEIQLIVSDNGKGISKPLGYIPSSLTRRAKLLKAQVSVQDNANQGTCVKLVLRTKKFRFKHTTRQKINNRK